MNIPKIVKIMTVNIYGDTRKEAKLFIYITSFSPHIGPTTLSASPFIDKNTENQRH